MSHHLMLTVVISFFQINKKKKGGEHLWGFETFVSTAVVKQLHRDPKADVWTVRFKQWH